MRLSLGAAWGAVFVASACDAPNVSMLIDVPASTLSSAAWIEIGAFPNACPPAGELSGGLPPSALAGRVAYAADASPVALGKLDTAIYGFAAIARRDDCGVIAAGCASADMSTARALTISLDTQSDPDASACTNGLVCNAARCLPPLGSDPNVGAGCSMVLVGAGPLPDAHDGGPFVTAPAIVATAGGFVIAYAEYLEADGTEWFTTQPIDIGGGALSPNQLQVSGHCPGQSKIDATGLAMGAAGGLAVVSRPPCVGQSGFDLFLLDATGVVSKQNTSNLTGAPTVALSTHALTGAATANRWLLAANQNGAAVLLSSDGVSVTTQTTTPFGTAQDTAARTVHTSTITAVEVDGPSVADGGATGTVGRVYATSGTTDPMSVGSPVDQVSAQVTALTADGSRAFLLTNGAGKGEDVVLRGYDLGKVGPVFTSGFSAAKTTPVLALDAAVSQGRVFCAVEQQDSVSIAVINGAASSSPQLLNRVDLASDIRIPKSAHDGAVAIAATDTRVAVTWVAHKDALADGDTLGGYAVFACRP